MSADPRGVASLSGTGGTAAACVYERDDPVRYDWLFRAERIKDANGLWYRLTCHCFVCRQRDDRLCEYIVGFIRSQPSYANFELVRDA